MDSRILARARLWLMSALLAAFPAFAAEPIEVVTTFSILGDITQRVGGDRIKVHTLVGPNADAHVYQPTPADAKAIAQARLVVVNGLGFEGWLERLIKSSGYRGKVATATNGIRTLQRSAHDHHDNVDPHAWQDLSNALIYVDNIGKALGEIDPSGKTSY